MTKPAKKPRPRSPRDARTLEASRQLLRGDRSRQPPSDPVSKRKKVAAPDIGQAPPRPTVKYVAPTKGKQCPDCGEYYQQCLPGSDTYDFSWRHDYESVPHTDMRDCIRYLRQKLNDAKNDLSNHDHPEPEHY